MSYVHAILHPVGITVSRLSIPVWEFNRCVAKVDVGPQLLFHGIFRYIMVMLFWSQSAKRYGYVQLEEGWFVSMGQY